MAPVQARECIAPSDTIPVASCGGIDITDLSLEDGVAPDSGANYESGEW